MAYDVQGFQPAVRVDTDRARFAADLARHANLPYGKHGDFGGPCALERFDGGTHGRNTAIVGGVHRAHEPWEVAFTKAWDHWPRQPTGFDCLSILQSIPA